MKKICVECGCEYDVSLDFKKLPLSNKNETRKAFFCSEECCDSLLAKVDEKIKTDNINKYMVDKKNGEPCVNSRCNYYNKSEYNNCLELHVSLINCDNYKPFRKEVCKNCSNFDDNFCHFVDEAVFPFFNCGEWVLK